MEPEICILKEFTDLVLWSLSTLHKLQEIYHHRVIWQLRSWASVAHLIDLEGLIIEFYLGVETWPPTERGIVVHETALADYIISIDRLVITENSLAHSVVHIDITSIGWWVGWQGFLIRLNYIRTISALCDNSTLTQACVPRPNSLCLTPTLLALHHLILSEIFIFDAD